MDPNSFPMVSFFALKLITFSVSLCLQMIKSFENRKFIHQKLTCAAPTQSCDCSPTPPASASPFLSCKVLRLDFRFLLFFRKTLVQETRKSSVSNLNRLRLLVRRVADEYRVWSCRQVRQVKTRPPCYLACSRCSSALLFCSSIILSCSSSRIFLASNSASLRASASLLQASQEVNTWVSSHMY